MPLGECDILVVLRVFFPSRHIHGDRVIHLMKMFVYGGYPKVSCGAEAVEVVCTVLNDPVNPTVDAQYSSMPVTQLMAVSRNGLSGPCACLHLGEASLLTEGGMTHVHIPLVQVSITCDHSIPPHVQGFVA